VKDFNHFFQAFFFESYFFETKGAYYLVIHTISSYICRWSVEEHTFKLSLGKQSRGMSISKFKYFIPLIMWLLLLSCSKETVLIPDNSPASSFNISRLKIENYVNRLYIDIIGREPLREELLADVNMLQDSALSREVRLEIIRKLMNDDSFREEEGSYKAAFVLNLYNLAKVRCLEGVSDEEIQSEIGIARFGALRDSLDENWNAYFSKLEQIRRYQSMLDSKQLLFEGDIAYHQVFSFAIDNGIYDRINMNTFNFVRAAFDELLWRLPTEQEFQTSFRMIEFSESAVLFGLSGSDKSEFIQILTESAGMMEGMIIWAFQTLLNRQPSPAETYTLLSPYIQNRDIKFVYEEILVTDEYANFR